jgi:phenylalanyl-tRNA synthetase beta chain
MGEVHPALAKKFGLKQQPLYLELRLSGLLPASVPPVRIPGARPYSRRSLAFSLPHGVEAQAVAQVIRQSGHSRLVAVDIVDLFEFQQEGATLRSITFSLAYENEDGSLKIEELNAATEELVAVVEERVIGVKQRK